MKTHMNHGCGRGKRTTSNVYQVDCGLCQKTPEYVVSRQIADRKREDEFNAQVPRQFAEPWKNGLIVCGCGNDTFRYLGRSCYGHYDEFVCAACGSGQSRLTETGMSF
jgi:hypothetical protein